MTSAELNPGSRLIHHGGQRRTRKRSRRTKAEIAAIKKSIIEILDEHNPQTIRQVYYQLVVKSVIEKLESEYTNVVIRLLTIMRMEEDTVPFEHIVDEAHTRVSYRTCNSLADAARDTARFYRRNALNECPDYLEIYVDKQALVGFVHEAAGEYDVDVIPGGTSISQIHETAARIKRAWRVGKKSYIYHFGDYDATGLVTYESTKRRLTQLCLKLGCPPSYAGAACTGRPGGRLIALQSSSDCVQPEFR